MIHESKDYLGKPLRVGDFARNIESGWLGRVDAFEVDSDEIDMCKMTGVDELAMTVAGLSAEECLDSNDTQWHAAQDLRRVRRPK